MSLNVAYIDCSELMLEALKKVRPDYATEMNVHLGDLPVQEIPSFCKGSEIIWNGHTMMDAALMDRLPDLKQILFLGSGPSSYIDLEAAARRGITVDRITGYGDRAVAEHGLALILAAMRNVAMMDRALRSGHWAPLEGAELAGRRLGLIGFGGIGRSLAGIARALDMEVSIWNRSPLAGDWAGSQVDLEELLAQSDVISLHLALTPETREMLSVEEFAKIRRQAILVNTARAGLVNTGAMIDALKEGRLAHAALDVFDNEPLPGDDPLLSAPNVTLTAHAGFKTREAVTRMVEAAVGKCFRG